MRVYFEREDGQKLEEKDMEAARDIYPSARKVDGYRFVIGSEKDKHLLDTFRIWVGKYSQEGFREHKIILDI